VILTLLVGITAAAGAWSLGLTAARGDESPAVVAPEPSGSTTASPRPSPTLTATATAAAPEPEHRYVVRAGDTLTDIARLVYGDGSLWQLILDANRDVIEDPDNLKVGTSLLIPRR
jgi:nucleoid-associated protein YgaU